MALPDIDTVLGWRGRTIVDESGEKLGKFEDIYLDTQTDLPEWAAVKTGLLGRKTLVPLSEAEEHGDDALRLPFNKVHIENAPGVDADAELSQDEEASLYAHYGLQYSKAESSTGLPPGEVEQGRPATGAAGEGATTRERGDESDAEAGERRDPDPDGDSTHSTASPPDTDGGEVTRS